MSREKPDRPPPMSGPPPAPVLKVTAKEWVPPGAPASVTLGGGAGPAKQVSLGGAPKQVSLGGGGPAKQVSLGGAVAAGQFSFCRAASLGFR